MVTSLLGGGLLSLFVGKMLLSRRACYKCGNIGHYAEVCSSSERLCYNCKQPGHESNGCPRPRTTETKQCYHCQGLGHVQADCPTLRLNGGASNARCYSCNLPGHLARNCPSGGIQQQNPQAVRNTGSARGGFNAGFRGGPAGYPRAATCYKCGGPNHFARDCQAQAMKCYACGKLGHISRDCTAPNGGPLSSVGKVCYKCSQAGHISRDCPTNNPEIKVPPTVTTEPTSTTLIPDVEVPVEAPAVTTGTVNSTITA
ncbi:hypothetical protein H112_02266 [Trichophyton rubrum D6]|uniref:CCHC-type domain-containing protein n=2 Tax=Trichophyton rubrum TaxID=5551 RepID=F2SU80_TRIRC|nr:uncharacterized protein TERG_06030 [Trichophyton rubrum CBS 118892]EZF25411.1 hypothetical protein H100_02266 [Trichophyton rubrum MR850]EZF44492.1 hypothetical protein H102_02263 [Trichophyton rubrum CBS 100081]EZF55090.1 hypothetical protein H103_02273 [Trichophyton rubrum CBS 288.86]EZF65713.1 hypothetical protein H104_02248 [Trichophyton rubrum CBS 289.86]EZF87002.1 hypothetical protein H110_02269 [Trichophyton rubrum MR1448]EZF97848.1 hypothetical protein H113_02272 [Trichophyton rubr